MIEIIKGCRTMSNAALAKKLGRSQKTISQILTRYYKHGEDFCLKPEWIEAYNLHQQGWSNRRIANELGCAEESVARWIKKVPYWREQCK
jgi:transposase